MSRSQRDSDIRKLRQLSQAKSALIPVPCLAVEVERIRRSPAYTKLQADFDRLFAKYGSNPDIFKENERAGSKRGVTRKIKDSLRRSQKRSEKQTLRLEAGPSSDISGDA
ncbi:hypothetical protein [Solilutibacter oculi]|uniref:hypothetical protein n=1 Tax=Solilutibacter oculi TaxID=2698682 RepID=UPI0013A60D80|nr:hypothetical protein [Lysobacter oculi]